MGGEGHEPHHPPEHAVQLGPTVWAPEITGRETVAEIIERMTAYVGREMRNGYRIFRRMVEEDHAIVLVFSGAMASAGLVGSTIIPLVRRGIVDAICTTHANVYHDLQRVCTHEFREVDPNAGDLALRGAGQTRIYDHVFPEETLLDADRLVQEIVLQELFQEAMTTPTFHRRLANRLEAIALQRNDAFQDRVAGTLVAVAAHHSVPMFCGAPQDASIWLNVAYLEARGRLGLGPKCELSIDLAQDIREFAAYHLLAKEHGTKKLSVLIFGGGVPKNYALQPEPFLSQVCGIATDGYDCDVQVCDAHVQNGGLSSCPAGEAHTWGKTSEACVLQGSQYVFADASLVAPLYVSALLGEMQNGTLRPKTPRRFLSRRGDALRLFDEKLHAAGVVS
ncbi:deoxyhypusine synthase family protein [Candidatus Uhrbacteria bacterium]|nr:deoxyhypusine synthase family protein [Candidatus Uhrbacteria bacterium]